VAGEQGEAQGRLTEQQKQLAARLADLEAQRNALAEERQQWDAQRSENASQKRGSN